MKIPQRGYKTAHRKVTNEGLKSTSFRKVKHSYWLNN